MGAVSFVSGSIVPVSGFLTGAALAGGLSGVIVERSGINRLLASLPVSRAEVIDSYWAVAMLFVLAASALYAAIGLPLGVLPGDLLDVPLVLIMGQALGIPVFLHFGRGRGLHVWAIAIVVLAGLGALVLSFRPIRDFALRTTTGHCLLLALGACALVGLWALSRRLYLKQDQ